MARCSFASGIPVCLFLGCLALAHAVTFEVKSGNTTCIKAEFSANFTISYNITNGTNTVNVQLPVSAVVGNLSSCGGNGSAPQLVALFGEGHSLSLVFSSDGQRYSVANLSLQYNLSDSRTFPQSTIKGIAISFTNAAGITAKRNTTYRCLSSSTLSLGSPQVNMTFSGVRLEAYMPSSNLSTEESVCSADQSATTASPTHAPTTTPTPSPVIPSNPDAGNYRVNNTNATACLLANMGLQLNITYFSKSQNKTVQSVVNVEPNRTSVSGLCEASTAVLLLDHELTNLSFTFSLNSTSKKYHLSSVNVSANWPDMREPFSTGNNTLQAMPGTLGRSYMCTPEQTLTVANSFSLNMFQVQVQPFGVQNNQFGSADVCPMQRDNMLVPIIVGACLAGLVVIVLIAYLIGRKRSHAGYQTI